MRNTRKPRSNSDSKPLEKVPVTKAVVAPFLCLNGDLLHDRMREVIGQCAEAGFDGIFLHAREGLRTPYMSEAWLEAIAFCVAEAGARGMASWLYDEFPYPSGVAGGKVIERNPDFAEKHLVIRRFHLRGPGRVIQPLGKGGLAGTFLVPIDHAGRRLWDDAVDATSRVGICNSTWISSDWDSRHYYDQRYSRLYQCRRSLEAFSEQVFQGDLPEGDWELLGFFKETGGDFPEPFGHYVDVSNRAATQAFLEETHERYRTRLGSQFGGQIQGIFTDEPKYRNALPWSDSIAAEWDAFQEDPKALLSLARDCGGAKERQSYRRTTSRLFMENWVRPIRTWCDNENLRLIGHISPEEDWWTESRLTGSILQHLREFTVPGCDLIIPAAGDHEHPLLNLTCGLAVSAAAQSGAPHAMCEAFGCSDYSLDPQTLKRVGDWLMVSGINFFVPHGCFYSLAGQRRFDAPPTFLPPMTLHRFLPAWTEHIRQTASFLGPQRSADVALVRPMSSIFAMSDGLKAEADALFQSALHLAQTLLDRGLSVHWLDDTDLEGVEVRDAELVFGKAAYRRIVVFEEPPVLSQRNALDGIRAMGAEVLGVSEALALFGPLHCAEGGVRIARAANVPRYFCVNLAPEPRTFELEGRPCALDGYESRWIAPTMRLPCHPAKRMTLGGDWRITPPARNVFRLLEWEWGGRKHPVGPVGDSLPEGSVPMVRMAIGPAPLEPVLAKEITMVYETEFHWDGPLQASSLLLCIEEEGILGDWHASLNEHELQAWTAATMGQEGIEHPLGNHIQRGSNRLRIAIKTSDARDGLLLPPFLSGNFEVTDASQARLAPAAGALRGKDWTRGGYPHFSGTMTFEMDFAWPAEDAAQDARLVFDPPPAGVLEIELNGHALGRLLWSPWSVALGTALRPGLNHLTLRVTNTLQNFIHGEARPSGPLDGAHIEVFRNPENQKPPLRPQAILHAIDNPASLTFDATGE